MENLRNYLTTPKEKYGILSEVEARKKLEILSEKFISFLTALAEVENKNKFRMIGLGNSISLGWSAISNNVEPLLEKCKEYLLEKSTKSGLDLAISSYSFASHNSNKEIFEAISKNISLDEIREIFDKTFDEWKNDFAKTPFENYVDKEKAMMFYPGGNQRILDIPKEDSISIFHYNGFTGAMLEEIVGFIFSKSKRQAIIKSDLEYLRQTIEIIQLLKGTNYFTVGNFPYVSTPIGALLNQKISKLNEKIKLEISSIPNTSYYDKTTLAGFQKYNGKIKIDNHPSIDEQYTNLVNYLMYLMESIPKMMEDNGYSEAKLSKVRVLD